MRSVPLAAIATGVVLALTFALRRRARRPSLNPERTLLIGDSLAVGLAPTIRALVQRRGGTFASDARTGTSAHQWARNGWGVAAVQGAAPTLGAGPTLVLISLGTNDMALAASDMRADAAALISTLPASAEVFWLVPPPMPLRRNAEVRAAIHAAVPASQIVEPPTDLPRAADGIHSSPAGYARWASDVWTKIGAES